MSEVACGTQAFRHGRSDANERNHRDSPSFIHVRPSIPDARFARALDMHRLRARIAKSISAVSALPAVKAF